MTQRVLDPNGPHQWFDPTSWVGGTIPQSGDTVLLSNEGLSLGSDLGENGATPSIQNVTIDMQGSASLGGFDVTLERDVVINVEDDPNASGSPTATWGANGTTIFRGALNLAAPQGTFDISISGQLGAGNLINAGAINLTNGMHVDVSAGILSGLTNSGSIAINGHSSFVNEGPLAGRGTIQIGDGSLTLDGGTDVNSHIVFGDGPGELVLDGTKSGIWGSGLNFEGVVQGFGQGDTIELIDPTASPISATYDSSRELLVLRDTANAVVSKIRMKGDFASDAFRVNTVGNGAFDVTLTSETVSAGTIGATLGGQQSPAFVGAVGQTAVDQPAPVDLTALSAASATLPSLPSHAASSFGFGSNSQLPTLAAFLRHDAYETPTTLLPLHG